MTKKKDCLKILSIPAWYPSEINPFAGSFIREHAKAISIFNDVIVMYAYPDPSPSPRRLFRVADTIESEIRTIRIRYGGFFFYYWRKLFKKKFNARYTGDSSKRSAKSLKFVLRFPFCLLEEIFYIFALLVGFRKLIKEGWHPDIIHANVLKAAFASVFISRIYSIPMVVTEHATEIATHSLTYYDRMKLSFSYNRAKFILPVSRDLQSSIINYYGIKTPSKTVPNVVNIDKFSLSFKSEKTKGTPIKMLLVGFQTPRKGIPFLLKALSHLKTIRHDFFLDIVGDGPNKYEYEEMSKNLGLKDVVKFHGTQQEITGFIKDCDFFVLPSLYENFGVVYIEAMACGKPVIATSAGGPSEFIDNSLGRLVPPSDMNALIEAIEFMLDNYMKFQPQFISTYVQNRFSYQAVGRQIDEIYRNIISNLWEEKLEKAIWYVGLSEKTVKIEKNWLVLDVGSGHNPNQRADILLDNEIKSSIHRSGKEAKIDTNKCFLIADVLSLPLKDKSIDYVIASHIAEHINNPEVFCNELSRVGKRGYIETPSKICEILLNEPFHILFVYRKKTKLIFERKKKATTSKTGWFYKIFYYGRKREGHNNLEISNTIINYIFKIINLLVIKIWLLPPIKRIMYTRFEWIDTVEYEIKR